MPALRLYPDPVLRRPSRDLAPADFAEPTLWPAAGDDAARAAWAASRPVLAEDGSRWFLAELAAQMDKDVADLEGHALAAVQLGVLVNLFVVQRSARLPEDCPRVVCNPRVVAGTETTPAAFHGEGCLSLPGVRGTTLRMPSFELEYQDLAGAPRRYACSGLLAVVVQHELDHLAGIMFMERVEPWSRDKVQKAMNRLRPRR